MRNHLLCYAAIIASCTFFSHARADQVVNGNLFSILDAFGERVGSTVDHWYFTVNSDDFITIDTLSWEVDTEDLFDGDGDVIETVDVNLDGETAYFDVYIYLFKNDGVLGVDDLVNSNDDSNETYTDGSLFDFDSFLGLDLQAGEYILAIGSFDLSADDAVTGVNSQSFYPVTSDGVTPDDPLSPFFPVLIPHSHGDYRITFTGDISVVVPEPISLGLVGSILFAGLSLCRRA